MQLQQVIQQTQINLLLWWRHDGEETSQLSLVCAGPTYDLMGRQPQFISVVHL